MSFTSKFKSNESQYKLVKQVLTFVCSENNLDFKTVWQSISNKDPEYFDRHHKREKRKTEPLAGLKKPRTAFSFFTQENRSIIAEKHPNLEFGEISKLVGSQWRGLNDSAKSKYMALQDEDRIRYETARQHIADNLAERTKQEQDLRDAEAQRQADIISAAEQAGIKAASEMTSTTKSATKKSKGKGKAKTQTAAASTSATTTESTAPTTSSKSSKKGKKGKKSKK